MSNNQRLNINNSFQPPLSERQQVTNQSRQTNDRPSANTQNQQMGDVIASQLGSVRLSSVGGDRQVVWGTNICMNEVSLKLQGFLTWRPNQDQLIVLNRKSERSRDPRARLSSNANVQENEPLEGE